MLIPQRRLAALAALAARGDLEGRGGLDPIVPIAPIQVAPMTPAILARHAQHAASLAAMDSMGTTAHMEQTAPVECVGLAHQAQQIPGVGNTITMNTTSTSSRREVVSASVSW